jgi:hypothetical protein
MKITAILFIVSLLCVDSSAAEIISKLEILEQNNIQDSIIHENQNEEENIVIINIFSGSVGERTIKLIEGKWPASIIFRLRTGFVDEISISLIPYGTNLLNISKKSFRKDGSPTDMQKYEWNKDHEYYEVILSKDQLSNKTKKNKTKKIKISWITYM